MRKQAKKLVRESTAENANAIARIRAHLPRWTPPLALRDAQFVLAREYGFDGWGDLREAVMKRIGRGLEWAASEAGRAIHDNDVERLKTLLADHPGLLTWRDEDGHPLLQATTPYAMDVTDPDREATFCRPDCAAVLIDAGALMTPSVWEALVRSGAAGMMRLLHEKKALPNALVVLAALDDLSGVRACLDGGEGANREAVNFAFMSACRFRRDAVVMLLLERCITLDPELGVEIDRWGGRAAFVADMIAHCPSMYLSMAPWVAFVTRQLLDAVDRDDLPAFRDWLSGQAWVLSEPHLTLQAELLGQAALANREAFIRDLLDRDPAILRTSAPPPSQALIWMFDSGHAHLAPLLTRIWPLPDDLPHAAGVGDLTRVKTWFDETGKPALGDLARHWRNDRPGAPTTQQVLDVALAWAVLNKHFGVAEFLLAHGADINTDWATHEPASILHECAMRGDFEGACFLIDHGIDPSLRDHRWNATAAGWAFNAAHDEAMADLLIEAEKRRQAN